MKKIKFKLKAILIPNKISPSSGIGPILGQYGINLIEFCNKFNKATINIFEDNINVKILVFEDNNYEILIGNFSIANKIKKNKLIEKFSKKPKIILIGKFFFSEILKFGEEIKKIQKISLISSCKILIGTLISMGFEI